MFQVENKGPPWSCSFGSWIYNYKCNQCLSPLTLRVRIPLRWGVLDTTLCDKVFSVTCGRSVSSTNKTDCYDITEILLKVGLNTTTLTLKQRTYWTLIADIFIYNIFNIYTNRINIYYIIYPQLLYYISTITKVWPFITSILHWRTCFKQTTVTMVIFYATMFISQGFI